MSRPPLTFPFVQTERSHEENQERAYIAASRRQDRSIEARIQSARMASEIHKARTGKGFIISEEIVRNEEMYEEDETDLPRSYRVLNPHMQTQSAEFNAKVDAWMSNKMFMADYMRRAKEQWENNHINRLFAESFPQVGEQSRQMSHHAGFSGPVGSFGSGHCHSLSPTMGNGSNPGTPAIAQPSFFDQDETVFMPGFPSEMKAMMGTNLPTSCDQNLCSQNLSNMGNPNVELFSDLSHIDHDGTLKLDQLDQQQGEFLNDGTWQAPNGEEPIWDNFLAGNDWCTDRYE
ncbi:hypothetical protein ACO1O0_007233 [Amphichorda felina]